MTQGISETPAIEPELSGVRNFRDVKGLPTRDGRHVKPGLLYRSGHLAHATAEDTAFLAGLGLHTVFDFRNEADIALEGPDVPLPGVRNLNLPLSDPADGREFWAMVRAGDLPALRANLGDGEAAARMVFNYRTMIGERTAEHGTVLRALADDHVPALMHCAAGKDRAGVSVAVALLALGVERDAIVADYLESNAPHRRYRVVAADGAEQRRDPEITALLSPFFEARAEYLTAAFDAIEETWGDVDAYLVRGLGLAPERRERLRERFLAG
ncbi:tyrosine-protein phosphatase [Streptomyces sp. BI20]|uniref:tyrosine-protein phosphatase n=1 Tax=Streptomyces sp. BI20 TaxID=3403460 RepID=UPI003C77DAE4